MLLNYYKGKNFGDALNPIVFNELLPGFFDADPSVQFVGIGSLIGMDMLDIPGRKVFFGTGYGQYGIPKKLGVDDEVICLRGPITAAILGVEQKYAVTDGASLLRLLNFHSSEKKFKYSLIPHWESGMRVDWQSLCAAANIHYINPMQEAKAVLKEISQTELLIAEAMHGAIVADTYRVPWIPIKSSDNIRELKWLDWVLSMEISYEPVDVIPYYGNPRKAALVAYDNSVSKSNSVIEKSARRLVGLGISVYHKSQRWDVALQKLEEIKNGRSFLSKDETLGARLDVLQEKLEYVKKKYG